MADTLVWISGASGGLGAALARTVPFPDAHVVDLSRSGGTPRTEHVPVDLADPAAWTAVAAHFAARLSGFTGRRAVFVHNAATLAPIGFAGEVDTAAYRDNVLLNSAAPQVLGHAFLAAVRAAGFAGHADLVQLTSGAARSAYPGWSGYGAGKAAVDQWVRTVGEEQRLRGAGVRVVAVVPGVVATRMQEDIRASDPANFPRVERFRQLHASGQLRAPDDAARSLWALLDGDVAGGEVVDLRDVPG